MLTNDKGDKGVFNWRLAAVGFLAVMLLAGGAYIGSYVTCKNAGGGMTGFFDCNKIDVIGACEFEGKLYPTVNESLVIWGDADAGRSGQIN